MAKVLRKNNEIERPDLDKARIVFLRPAGGLSGASFLSIYDQDQIVGFLPRKSYIIYDAKPGSRVLGVLYLRESDFLYAEVEGGKIYYVLCRRFDRFFNVVPDLTAIKKGSDPMKKVPEWLADSRKSSPTVEVYPKNWTTV